MKSWLTVVAGLLLAGAAIAAPFQNGSFELGGSTPCNTFNIPAGSSLITGWVVSTGNIDWYGAAPNCGWQASDGVASIDLVGSGAGGIGGIQQTFDTVAGSTYQVSFDLAGNYAALPVVKPLAVTLNGVTTNYTFDTTGAGLLNMGWTTKTLSFVATGSTSTITFVSDVSGLGGSNNAGAVIDNVRVLAAGAAGPGLPVPLGWANWGAALLVGLFAAAMLGRMRTRTRR